jgi:hypothetical protein
MKSLKPHGIQSNCVKPLNITSARLLIRVGACLILVALMAGIFYSGSLAASLFHPWAAPNKVTSVSISSHGSVTILRTPIGGAFLPVPQSPPETIETFAADCTTPKTDFTLGDDVCVKANASLDLNRVLHRIQLVDPAVLVESSVDVTVSPQTAHFTLPTATSQTLFQGTPLELTFDNRGTWLLNLRNTDDAGVEYSAPITVHDPVVTIADLQVSKLYSGSNQASAGGTLTASVWAFNYGPDAAQSVQIVDTTAANTTFLSVVQTSGPTFNCITPGVGSAGTTTCTRASLNKGDAAGFLIVYQVDASVGSGASATGSATATSTTTERDATDNSSTSTATLNNPNPPACTVTCPDNITVGTNAVDGQGNPGAIVALDTAEPTGTCGSGVTSSPASGSFFPVGPTIVSQTTGSGASCSFTVTVVNVPQPTISCPANQTAVTPSGMGTVSVSVGTPSFTGSLATLSSSRSDQQLVSDPYPIGVTTITWTATDQYGTTASCAQTVTVSSADAPTISCPANKTFAASAGDCQKTLTAADIGTPTSGGLNVTVDSSRGDHLALTDPYPAGQTVITWTATNSIGSASCTQTITITTTGDSTPPTLTIPADLNVTTTTCSALLDDELGVATATDNCTPAVNITRTGVPLTPSPNGSIACPTIANPARKCVENFNFPVGTTDVTYTATDAAGNQATGVQHVTVHETTPPTFTFVPGDVGVNNDSGLCGAFVGDATLGTATVSDNCDTTVIRSGVPAGNIFPVGDTVITYTAKADTSVTRMQHVIVADNTPPVVTAPGAVTLYTGSGATSCGVTVTDLNGTFGNGSATDNCPGVSAVTRGGVPAGNVFPVGPTTLTYSATDAHGNTSSANQLVTVVDNTPPTISCPANVTVYLPLNSTATSMAVNYPAATASDNCGSVGITYSQNSGTVFPVGPTTVTVTATDTHNNSSSCQFTVTVLYDFTGFFSPVANAPTLNSVNAGRAIPVKFSLSGNKGLNIFAAGNPYSVSFNCNTNDPGVDVTETVTAGGSSLSFGGDQYNYVWKTESSWAGTCRQLVLTLNDGSVHVANFKFK